MTTTATHNEHDTTTERVLFVAFELSEKHWKLGFTTGHGQKPRERTVAARHQARVLQEVAQAKRRFGLPESAPVVSCDEAGREGFWLHRFLKSHGITNHVVDSSSIEVNRRKRRAKSDALDVRKLVSMLIRFHHGEGEVWRVVHVPTVEAEDQRHLHRDLETLKQERASTTTRIQGLLSSQGIRLTSLSKFPEQLDELRLWDGSPVPHGLRQRLLRVWAHHEFLRQQISGLEAERRALLDSSPDASIEKGRQLMQLKGIWGGSAWGGSFTEVAGLTRWQLGAIKGEVDLGKTLVMERRPGLRFGWRTDQLEPGRKIVQTCVEGPGASSGKTLTISLSDEPHGRTLVQLSDAGWREDDPHLPLCNTYWGEALSRLRAYQENSET